MNEFTNKIHGVDIRFTVTEDPDVLLLVTFDSRMMENRHLPNVVRLWECAKLFIEEWECELIPNLHEDFFRVTGVKPDPKKDKVGTKDAPTIARIVEYVATAVAAYRRELDPGEDQKN